MRILLSLVAIAQASATFSDLEHYFGGENNQYYVNWATSVKYKSSLFLASEADPSDGAAVHWSISQLHVEIGVAVRAAGWIGFGISDNGGMKGTDMFIFEARSPGTILDAYVTEFLYPQVDQCQDWEFVHSATDGEFLIVQVRRKLITDDIAQDLPIHDDGDYVEALQKVIAPWGDSYSFGYHGQRRARGSIRWFNLSPIMSTGLENVARTETSYEFSVHAKNY